MRVVSRGCETYRGQPLGYIAHMASRLHQRTKSWAWRFCFNLFRDRRTTGIGNIVLVQAINLQSYVWAFRRPEQNNNDAIVIDMEKKHATTLSPMSKSPTNPKTLPRPQNPPDSIRILFLTLHFVPIHPRVCPNRGFRLPPVPV